jgi:hypothetical protein
VTKEYGEFRELFLESHVVANSIAAWWQGRSGSLAFMKPWHLTPNEESRWSHVDNGDIAVLATLQSKSWSAKCGNTFTCREDFPFKELIVEESYKVPGVARTCIGYAIANPERTHVAWVSMSTFPYWTLRTMGDGLEPGAQRKYYCCPVQYVKFEALTGPSHDQTQDYAVRSQTTA